MVDDGSPDNSLEIAVRLAAADPRLTVVELSRNFGHFKAMMTAIEHASGRLILLIDIDLEEPPEILSEFYTELKSGNWDVVYGYQEQRKGGLFERWSGALAWWLVRVLLPIEVPRYHCTARLMRRDYAQALVRHREHKTAIGGLWVETGFRQTGLPVKKSSRESSSYRLRLRLIVLLDSITSFSERPLYLIFSMGLCILTASVGMVFYLFCRWLSGHVLEGWVSVMASVWLLGGLAIFSIGVVGLYVSRIFVETKMRPYTIIRAIHNARNEAAL